MYRISVIPYVNALPLVHYLPSVCPELQLIEARPSQAMGLLDHSRVDLALVPVVDCLRRPDLHRISGLGICAYGPVTSVLLHCKEAIKSVRTIASDPASRTSNCLVRVLSRFHWQVTPRFVSDHESADARVVIGDRALTGCPSKFTYDLAEQWTILTGLPFVFAVWVCHKGRSDISKLTDLVHQAYGRSMQTMPVLARTGAIRLGLSSEICEHYLSSHLYYNVGPREELAMKRFSEYINELSQGGRDCLSSNATEIQGDSPYVKAC